MQPYRLLVVSIKDLLWSRRNCCLPFRDITVNVICEQECVCNSIKIMHHQPYMLGSATHAGKCSATSLLTQNSLHAGIYSRLLSFIKINVSKYFFHEQYQRVKQFGSRSGSTECPNCLQRTSADDKILH